MHEPCTSCPGAVVRLLFPESVTLGATLPAGSAAQSLVLETLLTLTLMVVILMVAGGGPESKLMGGVVVGGGIALEALFVGPISGALAGVPLSKCPQSGSGRRSENTKERA